MEEATERQSQKEIQRDLENPESLGVAEGLGNKPSDENTYEMWMCAKALSALLK